MDITPYVQTALSLGATVAVAFGAAVVHRLLLIAQSKIGLQFDAQDEAAIDGAINTGVGLLRARLASGTTGLKDIHLGSTQVDAVAETVLALLSQTVAASGLSKEEIATKLVGAIGHAVGNDPSIPSVPYQPYVPPEADTTLRDRVAGLEKIIALVANAQPGATPPPAKAPLPPASPAPAAAFAALPAA